MNWNHRVVRTVIGTNSNGPIYQYEFAEVYYNEHGIPNGYSAPFVHGESIDELKQLATRLTAAAAEPIVDGEAITAHDALTTEDFNA